MENEEEEEAPEIILKPILIFTPQKFLLFAENNICFHVFHSFF